MRSYSITDYPKEARERFHFLVKEYGYKLREENQGLAYVIEYNKADRRVLLNYDKRDNFFYFILIRGRDTVYPNDLDAENIKPFYELGIEFGSSEFDPASLQPDEYQYLEALENNAQLLRTFGKEILQGEAWFC